MKTPNDRTLPDGARLIGKNNNRIQISGEDVTLDGFDFTGFFITAHASGFTLRNSFCRDTTGGGPLIDLYPEADGWRLENFMTWGEIDASVTIIQQRAEGDRHTTGTIDRCRFMRPRVDILKTTGNITVTRSVFDAPRNVKREHADHVTFLSRRGPSLFEDCDFFRAKTNEDGTNYSHNTHRIHPNNEGGHDGEHALVPWDGEITVRKSRIHGDPNMISFPVHARFEGGPILFEDCEIAGNRTPKYFHHERDGAVIRCVRCVDMWSREPIQSLWT